MKNDFKLPYKKKTVFGMDFVLQKMPQLENMHFHFCAFSDWGTFKGQNNVDSIFFCKVCNIWCWDTMKLPQPHGFRNYGICIGIYHSITYDHLTPWFASLWRGGGGLWGVGSILDFIRLFVSVWRSDAKNNRLRGQHRYIHSLIGTDITATRPNWHSGPIRW